MTFQISRRASPHVWAKRWTLYWVICGLAPGCIGPRVPISHESLGHLDSPVQLDLEPEVIEALEVAHQNQDVEPMHDGVCAQCHVRQASEYARSTMRYGLFSPTFNAFELSLNQLSDGRFTHGGDGAFCTECHGPNATQRGLRVSDQRATRDALSERQATEGGIGCDTCHTAFARRGSSEGLKPQPSTEKLSAHDDPTPNVFHDYATPQQAEDRALARLSSSEFCAPCHDVRPQVPDMVEGTDSIRSEDLFSEWARSPWADPNHPLNPLRGVRGIDGVHEDPEKIARGEQVTCQDCHMSLYPQRTFYDRVDYQEHFAGVDPEELSRKSHKLYPAGEVAAHGHLEVSPQAETRRRRVSTHYFSGASHPLVPFDARRILDPTPLDPISSDATDDSLTDERAVSAVQWLERWRSWRATEHGAIGAWGELRSAHERRAQLLKAALTLSLDEVPERAMTGEPLRVDAWVENTGAGHNIPAGFSQEREVWVALTLEDRGRPCARHDECADLTERALFLNDPNRYCVVHDSSGARDPALPESGAWEEAARAERSGVCGEAGYCVLYRSGYLIDRDGDGLTHDEDLRHVLIERDELAFEERCVLPGPDADARLRGVERGLVHFTNALQRVEVDELGQPVEHPSVTLFTPSASPPEELDLSAPPLALQDPASRRALYPTERALYEQSRYRPAPAEVGNGPQRGFGLNAPTLLSANRAFNGHALRPFEPRLARYDVDIPESAVGPLELTMSVQFRFFSPRLLRTLAARHPDLVREEMIDAGLEIVEMAQSIKTINLADSSD